MGLKDACRAISAYAGKGNTFIELVTGPSLSARLEITNDCAAFPVTVMGNAHHIALGVRVLSGLKIRTDDTFLAEANRQGQPFNSVTALVYRNLSNEQFALAADGKLRDQDRHRALLTFYLGASVTSIMRATIPAAGQPAMEFLAPRYRGVPRANGDPISADLLALCASERSEDDRLHYWIATLEQAHAIDEEYFKISRLFSLLEAIASSVVADLTRQYPEKPVTRTAIRYMLGYYVNLDIPRFTILPGTDYEFDHIELAGRVRHKIFHGGGRLSAEEVPVALRPGIALLERRPDMISHVLRRDAELEIARWARREGVAWKAAEGNEVTLPRRDPNYTGKELAKMLISSEAKAQSAIGSAFVQVVGGDIGAVRLGLGNDLD